MQCIFLHVSKQNSCYRNFEELEGENFWKRSKGCPTLAMFLPMKAFAGSFSASKTFCHQPASPLVFLYTSAFCNKENKIVCLLKRRSINAIFFLRYSKSLKLDQKPPRQFTQFLCLEALMVLPCRQVIAENAGKVSIPVGLKRCVCKKLICKCPLAFLLCQPSWVEISTSFHYCSNLQELQTQGKNDDFHEHLHHTTCGRKNPA